MKRLHFFTALACFVIGQLTVRAGPVDVLLVADETILAPLRLRLTDSSSQTRAGWTLWRGTLAGKQVALARTEGDPLNAVAATTLGVRWFAPRLVLTAGTARAHDLSLQSGDLVVSEKFVAFDGMVTEHRELGAGSDALTWKKLPHALMTPGEKEVYTDSFPADSAAIAVALTLKPAHGRTVTGVLGSAHQINREADRIAALRKLWGTSTEDAESAHVAGCAKLFNVPVVGLRIVDGNPSEVSTLAMRFLEALK